MGFLCYAEHLGYVIQRLVQGMIMFDSSHSTTWYASNMGMSSPPAERSVITWSSSKEDMLLSASMMSSPEKDLLRL